MATLAQLAERFATSPVRVNAEIRRAVTVGGTMLGQSARRRQPVSGRLRGVGQSGAPIGVKVFATVGFRRPTSLITATGPAWLLDNPTRAHTITARRGRALRVSSDDFRRSVKHPGTPGKHTFDTGIAEAVPAAKAVVEAAFIRAGRVI